MNYPIRPTEQFRIAKNLFSYITSLTTSNRISEQRFYSTLQFFLLISVCIFSVMLRIPFLEVPFITDEGGAAYAATFWPSHQMLYKDINYDRFQGFFLIYKAILFIFGSSVSSIRLGMAVYNVGTVISVIVLTGRFGNKNTALLAGILFSLFSISPSIEGFTANSEMFAILPITLSALMLWDKRWGLSGILAGAAVMFKPIGISALLLIVMWGLFQRSPMRKLGTAFLGFLLFPIISAIHGFIIDWQSYWDTFVTYRFMAFSLFSQEQSSQLTKLYGSLKHCGAIILFLIIPSVPCIFGYRHPVKMFFLFWAITSVFGMALGGEWHWHYFVQIIPQLCVTCALGLVELKKKAVQWRVAILLCTLLNAGLCYTTDFHFFFKKPNEISWLMYRRPEYLVSGKIAKYILESTSPGDTIYVAFGQADLYYQSHRLAAVPQQLYWKQIEQNKDLWLKVLKSIQNQEPALVVWVQRVPHWGRDGSFHKAINEGYQLERELPFLALYRNKKYKSMHRSTETNTLQRKSQPDY